MAGIRHHCSLGIMRLGRRSDMDPHVVADAGRNGLYIFPDFGGVSDRSGNRQQRRIAPGPGKSAAARRTGLEPDDCGCGTCLDSIHAYPFPPLLADQSVAVHEFLVHIPDRPGPLHLDHPSGGLPVGRELSAGVGCGYPPGTGLGPRGRARFTLRIRSAPSWERWCSACW